MNRCRVGDNRVGSNKEAKRPAVGNDARYGAIYRTVADLQCTGH
jgi:hypothetical protein